jgi:hypothetical protein
VLASSWAAISVRSIRAAIGSVSIPVSAIAATTSAAFANVFPSLQIAR